MKSLMGLPNTHIAGDNFVSGSGVLRYCSMALWSESVSSSPFGPVLDVMSLFAVLTPISALQFEWGMLQMIVGGDSPFLQEFGGGG